MASFAVIEVASLDERRMARDSGTSVSGRDPGDKARTSRKTAVSTCCAEAPQVLGALVRRFGRFDIAEDAVQEALLAASRTWPADGVPEDPRSWLIRIGYRRMIDLLRSDQARRRREQQAGMAELAMQEPARANTPSDDDSSPCCCCAATQR